MQFSYIICYRHQDDRFKNLLKVVSYLRDNFQNTIEIILVEQDEKSRILNKSIFDNYIFTFSDRPCNRSWAFNVGALNSKSDNLYFGDCDIICPKSQIEKSIEILNKKGCVSPYNSIIDLTIDESIEVDMQKWDNEISRKGRSGINISGGIIAFKKEDFFKISGWCEDFEGWGGEDDFQTWKIKKWLNWEELEGTAYHLYHANEKRNTYLYNKNLETLKKRYQKGVEEWVINSKENIGNINKYINTTKKD